MKNRLLSNQWKREMETILITKILANDAMPSWAVFFVKHLLYVLRYILLYIILLKRLQKITKFYRYEKAHRRLNESTNLKL